MIMMKETTHFISYYHDEEQNLAEKFVSLLEEKYAELQASFGFEEGIHKYCFQISNNVDEYIAKTGKKKEEYQSWMVGFSNYESFTITILSPNVVTDRTMEDMEKVAVHELVHMMFDDFTKVSEDDAEPWIAEGIAILYAEQTELCYIDSSDYPKVIDLSGFENFVDNFVLNFTFIGITIVSPSFNNKAVIVISSSKLIVHNGLIFILNLHASPFFN